MPGRATGRRHNELEAILDATADGILAVDQDRRVILTNRRFAELWRIPDELVQAGDETALLHHVADQLARPEEFLGKVEELMRSDATVFDTLALQGWSRVRSALCAHHEGIGARPAGSGRSAT